MSKRRMSVEEMTGVLRQLADTDLLDHELTHYEEQAREILSAEGAPTEYAPELIDYRGLSERGRDARKVLTAARAVRHCRREGNLDWAAIQAMAVVTAATRAHMRLFEPDVARGQKELSDSQRGHEATYGTPDEKAQKYRDYQDYIDQAHKEHPGLNRGQLNEKAARKFRVLPKTIERHTKNPRK